MHNFFVTSLIFQVIYNEIISDDNRSVKYCTPCIINHIVKDNNIKKSVSECVFSLSVDITLSSLKTEKHM